MDHDLNHLSYFLKMDILGPHTLLLNQSLGDGPEN